MTPSHDHRGRFSSVGAGFDLQKWTIFLHVLDELNYEKRGKHIRFKVGSVLLVPLIF